MAPPSSSQPALTNASTSSVRRNLFSSHLSRRPASSTSTSSTNDLQTLHSATQPQSHSHSHPIPTTTTTTTATTSSDPTIPANDIILRDAHGRPSLPTLPTLPPHLHLSPSSSDQHIADGAGGGGGGGDTEYASQLELEDALREKEDKERIEKSLVEMMYRSRSRAHGHATRHGGAGSAGPSTTSFGPEHEELLQLVQASLRKKAASLEDDRWMFEAEGTVR